MSKTAMQVLIISVPDLNTWYVKTAHLHTRQNTWKRCKYIGRGSVIIVAKATAHTSSCAYFFSERSPVLISNHTLNFNGQDQMSWPEEWLNQRPIHFEKNKKLFIARENCVFYSITFGTERGWNCECTVLTALQQSKIHVQIFSTLMSGSDLIDHQIIWFTASAHGFSSSKIEWLCRWNIMLLEYHALWTA